jgi:hypothetical protein
MLLSARMLVDVASVNSYQPADTARLTENDTVDVFFQLIDKSLDLPNQGFWPSGRRYMPATGATLKVTAQSIDGAKTVVRFASQPYPQDPSIWRLSLLATDQVRGTYAFQLELTEGGKVTRGVVQQAISVESLTQSFC